MPQDYFPITGVKDSQSGREFMLSPNRELRSTDSHRLCGRSFDGSALDTNYWTSTLAVSGTATVANGIISLTTIATTGSSAKVVSVDTAFYVASSTLSFRSQGRFVTAGQANNVRRFGAYDANNGLFFQLAGTTFSVGSRKGGSDTLVNSGSFNGNIALTYDPSTTTHTYEIVYGVLTAEFYIDGVLLHKLNSNTTPLMASYSLPITIENTNTGASTATTFECRGASIARLGGLFSSPISFYTATQATTTLKLGAGILHGVFNTSPITANAITLYDNTAGSGTIIMTARPATNNPAISAISPLYIPFNIGLTIVTSGANGGWLITYE